MAPGFLAQWAGPRPQTVRAVIGHGPDLDRSDVSREAPERHARDPVLGPGDRVFLHPLSTASAKAQVKSATLLGTITRTWLVTYLRQPVPTAQGEEPGDVAIELPEADQRLAMLGSVGRVKSPFTSGLRLVPLVSQHSS